MANARSRHAAEGVKIEVTLTDADVQTAASGRLQIPVHLDHLTAPGSGAHANTDVVEVIIQLVDEEDDT